MIYQVKLHYYNYNFTDAYDALKFAEMAFRAAESAETVELRLVEEEADNE